MRAGCNGSVSTGDPKILWHIFDQYYSNQSIVCKISFFSTHILFQAVFLKNLDLSFFQWISCVFSYASSCKQEASRCCFDMTRVFLSNILEKNNKLNEEGEYWASVHLKSETLWKMCLNKKKLQMWKLSVALLLLKKTFEVTIFFMVVWWTEGGQPALRLLIWPLNYL